MSEFAEEVNTMDINRVYRATRMHKSIIEIVNSLSDILIFPKETRVKDYQAITKRKKSDEENMRLDFETIGNDMRKVLLEYGKRK